MERSKSLGFEVSAKTAKGKVLDAVKINKADVVKVKIWID